MSTTNADTVRRVYDDFERGDLERVLAAFDPEIEWIEPDGYFPGAGGAHRGVEAVKNVLSIYPEVWEEFSIEVDEVIDAGDVVVVTGRQRGRARETGRSFTARVANIWNVEDGRLVRLRVYTDTALIWAALGGAPATS